MQEAVALHDFSHKPLVVLTAGSGSAAGWSEKQNAMAKLSTNAAHRVIDGATHGSMVADQTHALSTSRAIIDIVTSVAARPPMDR